MEKITQELVKKVIKKRNPKSHKGNYGRVLLVGGNQQYGGAILMASEACVYSGAGLVTVACAKEILPSLRARLPEAMGISFTDFSLLEKILSKTDVVVIGPGLGDTLESRQVLEFVLSHQKKDQVYVIDGSAIDLLAKKPFSILFKNHVLYTPHAMEWQRLSGIAIKNQTLFANQQAQEQLGSLVVLKGAPTRIYTAEKILENTTGTPAEATGGMGDTLTGILGSFIGQFYQNKMALLDVVAAGVFIHSYIPEVLAKKQYVVLPTDIAKALPFFMKQFES